MLPEGWTDAQPSKGIPEGEGEPELPEGADVSLDAMLSTAYAKGAAEALRGRKGRMKLGQNLKENQRRKGQERGRQKAREAAARDRRITQLVRRWTASDELRDQYRTAAEYVVAQTGLARSSVYRRLKALQSHKPG
ncbi:MAG: hypothetical protein IT183_14290 [Acidobacteria bacterium]|nr:hypothetical protein [Acidobacteriota bacterium]